MCYIFNDRAKASNSDTHECVQNMENEKEHT